MGQALRRATAKVRSNSPSLEPPPPSTQPAPKVVDIKPVVTKAAAVDNLAKEDISRINPDNVLEDRDPGYDAMLNHMVGRIKTKPGGKLEMGEAFVVEKYDRPMPKLRNTKPESNYYEGQPAPPGTLNVAQLRQMLLLHQGKAKDHDGPMDVQQIAERFQIDMLQVQKILQFVSLPPED
ncbi:hypothetical protein IFM89_020569 [Coptis chinensis]|uniref:Uncharacterized protein n=1 Tax=Coptis chinensis TaxID=261450 RepID=A0A835IBZ9_9MAGN|nr:hypothetical protein IFM89_020569 [Coptis chinensis]